MQEKQSVRLCRTCVKFTLALLAITVCSHFARAQEESTRHVPYLPSSNDTHTGVLRLINHSEINSGVRITGFDDEGTEFGPANLSIGGQENLLILTDQLEDGTGSVEVGLGHPVGSWRLQIESNADVEITAYAEGADGLLASLQETVQGEYGCWRVPTFYSADNLATSKLRVTNESGEVAKIKISGRDDRGTVSASPIELEVASQVTKTLSAADLEDGTSDITGSLGNGRGNWQLAIESDRLITVMNLVEGDRAISNVSSRPSYAVGHCWLGKTLANADRSIGKLLQAFVAPEGLEGTAQITPALYAAIIDETGVRAIAAEGIKKFGTTTEASIHDRLYLGSITKPMTATMIATLVFEDESVFTNGWDTSIQDVYGEFLDEIHEDYHEVKIREIITHLSGIGEYPGLWQDDPELPINERRQAAVLATLTLAPAAPRGRVTYSHAGYVVAAAMAERLTGQSWESLMRERIFEPLGMATAGFGPSALLDDENEPWGHRLSEDLEWNPTQDDWHVVLQPAVGVHSNMEDLGKFLQLWMYDKEPMLLNSEQLHSLMRLLFPASGGTLLDLGSGLHSAGWSWIPSLLGYGEALASTPGSNGNWNSFVWVMRDISRAYVVVTNSTLPDGHNGERYPSIWRVLRPAVNRLATSSARSAPPSLPSVMSD